MKTLKIVSVVVMVMLASSAVLAMKHLPEERGKTLFNDPKLGNGTAGKSCNTCHPGGKGLEGVGREVRPDEGHDILPQVPEAQGRRSAQKEGSRGLLICYFYFIRGEAIPSPLSPTVRMRTYT